MWKPFEIVFPSIANWWMNKKVKEKIKKKNCLDLPSNDSSLSKISLDELYELFETDLHWKDKLEDKAKTNVIGVTICVTLVMGAYTLVQNISDKYGLGRIFWIAFCFFVFAVLYMLAAGVHAIRVLTGENIVYCPSSGLEPEEKKKDLDLQIGLNRAQNTIRNNYVFTSYECIRNALVCLFIVMIIAIMPGSEKEEVLSDSHVEYYYSAQAIASINSGIDKDKVEAFINTNISDGDYSVIDQADSLFIKYTISNKQVTIHLIEMIDTQKI